MRLIEFTVAEFTQMSQWDPMVNWREEFESRRRIEAARRLFYSHPSVAVRCRTSLRLKATRTITKERTSSTTPNSNLPSITPHSIEGIKLPITTNPKAASAPSILRSQKSNQLFVTHQHQHHAFIDQQRTIATPPGPHRMMIASSMLTSRQILPTITNIKAPAGNSNNKNHSFPFSTSKDTFIMNPQQQQQQQQKDIISTTLFDSNSNIPIKGWGQRCQTNRPSLHPPPEDIELSIKSIEPVLKNITLNDTLLQHDEQEDIDTVLNVNPPQPTQPPVWRQDESIILSSEQPNNDNINDKDIPVDSQPAQPPPPPPTDTNNDSGGVQMRVTFSASSKASTSP